MPNPIHIPDDTKSLHNIGDFIMSYQPYQNAFLSALVNRIGLVLITSKSWNNPLAVFKQGTMEMGETVEEIFVNIAKPHSFDPENAENKVWKREMPDVRAAFHTMNFQKFYKQSISQEQLRQAFLSWQGITDLVAKIVEAMYTAMAYDEYVVMKYMVCREAINGGMFTKVTADHSDVANLNSVVTDYRAMSSKLTFLSDKYNRARVMNSTAREEQYILIDAETYAKVDVNVLAQAFNMSKADWLGHVIEIDSFSDHDTERLAELFAGDSTYVPFTSNEITALSKISNIVTDKKYYMVFDNMQQMNELFNGEGLYWQYWLHYWRTFSVSPYANAVCFTSQTSSITSVTISPASATVNKGTATQFSATVNGTGLIDKNVVWKISGNTSVQTEVNENSGVVYVSPNETASSITLTATAIDGKTKNATITIN